MPLTKRAIRKLKLGLADELKIAMGLRPGWLVTILSESISGESRKKKELLFLEYIVLESQKCFGRAKLCWIEYSKGNCLMLPSRLIPERRKST